MIICTLHKSYDNMYVEYFHMLQSCLFNERSYSSYIYRMNDYTMVIYLRMIIKLFFVLQCVMWFLMNGNVLIIIN